MTPELEEDDIDLVLVLSDDEEEEEETNLSTVIQTSVSALEVSKAALLSLDAQIKRSERDSPQITATLIARRNTLINTLRSFLQVFYRKTSSVCTDG